MQSGKQNRYNLKNENEEYGKNNVKFSFWQKQMLEVKKL